MALPCPTSLGSRWVPPADGIDPSLTAGKPKQAPSVPILMSHARASSSPGPRPLPLMAAMTGCLSPRSRFRYGWRTRRGASAAVPCHDTMSGPIVDEHDGPHVLIPGDLLAQVGKLRRDPGAPSVQRVSNLDDHDVVGFPIGYVTGHGSSLFLMKSFRFCKLLGESLRVRSSDETIHALLCHGA